MLCTVYMKKAAKNPNGNSNPQTHDSSAFRIWIIIWGRQGFHSMSCMEPLSQLRREEIIFSFFFFAELWDLWEMESCVEVCFSIVTRYHWPLFCWGCTGVWSRFRIWSAEGRIIFVPVFVRCIRSLYFPCTRYHISILSFKLLKKSLVTYWMSNLSACLPRHSAFPVTYQAHLNFWKIKMERIIWVWQHSCTERVRKKENLHSFHIKCVSDIPIYYSYMFVTISQCCNCH